MGKPKNDEAKDQQEFMIEVEEHEKFNPITDSEYCTSTDFCQQVSSLMKAVYSDCEGCTFELTQQGQPVINLFFNHNELDDPTRVPGISRKISSDNIKSDVVRRVRNNDNRNKFGDRYYLTTEGKEGLDDFLINNIPKQNGKINWDKITAEVSQGGQFYGQRQTQYTKVFMLDPSKLAAAIYGSTDENGNNIEYLVVVKKSVHQMVGTQFQPSYMLEIKRVYEKAVMGLCNQLGIAPVNGLDIIR